jgi:hypothetical protein
MYELVLGLKTDLHMSQQNVPVSKTGHIPPARLGRPPLVLLIAGWPTGWPTMVSDERAYPPMIDAVRKLYAMCA